MDISIVGFFCMGTRLSTSLGAFNSSTAWPQFHIELTYICVFRIELISYVFGLVHGYTYVFYGYFDASNAFSLDPVAPPQVSRYNIEKLRKVVRNGPDVHPGANQVNENLYSYNSEPRFFVLFFEASV